MDSKKLLETIVEINSLFSLEQQGKELVSLAIKLVKCPGACLLFRDMTGEFFSLLACKPSTRKSHLSGVTLGVTNAVIEQLVSKQRVFTRDEKVTGLLLKELSAGLKGDVVIDDFELVIPVISNEHLMGILLLERRKSGGYTPEDIEVLEYVYQQLSPGLEKEYLREKMVQREKELTALNHCGMIVSSSLDTAAVYGRFVGELKQIVDVDWSALTLLAEEDMDILAVYSDIGIGWQTRDRIPLKGTAVEWVTASRMPLVEADLTQDSMFATDIFHRQHGIRSIVYVPLLVHPDEAVGSLIIGSCKPEVYTQTQVEFLRELAVRISEPVRNARHYAEVLKKARYDELTGLLNRRSMDEQILSEINRHSRYGGVFSLIILDLDSLKQINDKYGHLAGDGLLSRTGSIIKDAIRSADQAFRYGGDEFAILLPNTPGRSAVKVSERVRKRLATKLVVDDMTVTASFGLASWPDDGTEAIDVVAAADAALYKAKHLGGNRSCYADNDNRQ